MRKLKLSIATLFGIIVIGLLACNKGDSTSMSAKMKLLTSAPWIMVSEQQKLYTAQTWTDSYALLKACDKDNRTIYNANGTYEANEGPTKCNGNDPQIIATATWTMTASETGFTVIGSNWKQDITIESLTETTLSISFLAPVIGGNANVKETFVH